MINKKFIYSKTKDSFIEQLDLGNILDETIVFIADTKEIWNHGTYFDCSSLNIMCIDSTTYTAELFNELQENNYPIFIDKYHVLSFYASTSSIYFHCPILQDDGESMFITERVYSLTSDGNISFTNNQFVLIHDGNGTQYLSDDGTYKSVPTKLSDLTDDVVSGNYLQQNGAVADSFSANDNITIKADTVSDPKISFISLDNATNYLFYDSNIKDWSVNDNLLYHSGNLNGTTLTSFMNFYEGSNTVTSVSSIPVTKRFVEATISASASFTLSSIPAKGREIHIVVKNSSSSDIVVTLPNSGNYICLVDTALNIEASSYAEINAISNGSKVYIRSI